MRYVKIEGYTVYGMLNNLIEVLKKTSFVYLLDRDKSKIRVVADIGIEDIIKIIEEMIENHNNRYEFYYKEEQ